MGFFCSGRPVAFLLSAGLLTIGTTVGTFGAELSVGGAWRLLASPAGQAELSVGVVVSNEELAGRSAMLTAQWFDREGRPVAGGRRTVPVSGSGERKLSVPELPVGLYSVKLQLRSAAGKQLAEKETSFSVTPPIPEEDRPREMGTCTHFEQNKGNYLTTFQLLRLAGFTRVRDGFAWENLEPGRGKYQIPRWSELFAAACRTFSIRPLMVVTHPNRKAYPDGMGEHHFPVTPEARTGYANAVAYAARHFAGIMDEWEIFNEANAVDALKEYLPLLSETYDAVKKANPAAQVISNGGSGPGGGVGGGHIYHTVRNGGADAHDGFSIHPYMCPHAPDVGYPFDEGRQYLNIQLFLPNMQKLAGEFPRSDGRKPSIWITEMGWSSASNTELEQAAYLARMFLLYRRYGGVSGVYWYDFQNDGDDPANGEQNFGLIRTDYSPKPAYQAAAVFAAALRNLPFREVIRDDDKVRAYAFGDRTNEVVAAWSADGKGEIAIPWRPSGDKTLLVDWEGRPMEVKRDSTGAVLLKLDKMPCYLIAR